MCLEYILVRSEYFLGAIEKQNVQINIICICFSIYNFIGIYKKKYLLAHSDSVLYVIIQKNDRVLLVFKFSVVVFGIRRPLAMSNFFLRTLPSILVVVFVLCKCCCDQCLANFRRFVCSEQTEVTKGDWQPCATC